MLIMDYGLTPNKELRIWFNSGLKSAGAEVRGDMVWIGSGVNRAFPNEE